MGIVINEMNILPLHINYFNEKILYWNEDEGASCYFAMLRNMFS